MSAILNTDLNIVYAPNSIFRKKAHNIDVIDESTRALVDAMLDIMYSERAIGIAANMVGVLKRIALVDLQTDDIKNPYVLINPVISWYSDEMQTFNERSLSFVGISADITRPKAIKLDYTDYNGVKQNIEAKGFLATVVQHEVDYLNGKIFLDYLSKLKQDSLLKKMAKYIKLNPPHVHGAHCKH